ncbi:fungal-specific transcription factor domain-containing protein [Phycomyces blakesleeanus]
MESLLVSLTRSSIKELEQMDFRLKTVQVETKSPSPGPSDSSSEEEEMEYDSIKYTGQSAGLQLLDQELFKAKPYVRWPGRDDLVLQMMAHNELMVVRKDTNGSQETLDVGLSMRSSIFDNPTRKDIPITHSKVSASVASRMVSFYFSHLHPFLPIINRTRFLTHAHQPTILTNAILALSFRFASLYFPNLTENSQEHAGTYFRKVMHRLRDTARSRLCHVQAAILMTLYLDLDDGDVESIQWCTLGSAIRMAQDLGLHRSATHWKLPPAEIETRHRIFYACYILDRWMGARAGKPLTILDRDFDTAMPSAYEGDQGPIYQPFILLIKLSEILGRVLKALYAPNSKNSNRNAGLDDPTIRVVFDRRLRLWKESLEDAVGGVYMTQSQKTNLQVFYYTVVMLLHRPFVVTQELFPDMQSIVEESRHTCTEAATNLSKLVRQKALLVDDPESFSSMCLPTFFVYALFQSSLVHLSNARHDRTQPDRLFRLHQAVDLVREHKHIGPASRALDILTMLITLHDLAPGGTVKIEETENRIISQSQQSHPPAGFSQVNEMPKAHWFQRMINTSIVGGITPDIHHDVATAMLPTDPYGFPLYNRPIDPNYVPQAPSAFTAFTIENPTLPPSSLNWADWDLYLDQQSLGASATNSLTSAIGTHIHHAP